MTPDRSALRLSRIGQIAVNVADLDRAVAFYRDVLGMPFQFQVPRMAFFDCSGVRLMLALPETSEFDHPASILYYTVEDIQEAYETLRERSVTFDRTPELVHTAGSVELWMTSFRDTENNLLALMSEIRRE